MSYNCRELNCEFSCLNKCVMTLHKILHKQKLPPYKCDQCAFMFPSPAILLDHLATHSDEQPYSCTICDFVTSSHSRFKSHGWEHRKAFQCNFCWNRFSRKDELDTHMQAHEFQEASKRFQCGLCEFKCDYIETLKSHSDQNHANTFKCEICTVECRTLNALMLHTGFVHKDLLNTYPNVNMYEDLNQLVITNLDEEDDLGISKKNDEYDLVCHKCGTFCVSRRKLKKHSKKCSNSKLSHGSATYDSAKQSMLSNSGSASTGSVNISSVGLDGYTVAEGNASDCHLSAKPFVCATCCNRYTSQQDFQNHVRECLALIPPNAPSISYTAPYTIPVVPTFGQAANMIPQSTVFPQRLSIFPQACPISDASSVFAEAHRMLPQTPAPQVCSVFSQSTDMLKTGNNPATEKLHHTPNIQNIKSRDLKKHVQESNLLYMDFEIIDLKVNKNPGSYLKDGVNRSSGAKDGQQFACGMCPKILYHKSALRKHKRQHRRDMEAKGKPIPTITSHHNLPSSTIENSESSSHQYLNILSSGTEKRKFDEIDSLKNLHPPKKTLSEVHKCLACSVIRPTLQSLKIHQESAHCKILKLNVNSPAEIEEQAKKTNLFSTIPGSHVLQCLLCPIKVKSYAKMRNHLTTVHKSWFLQNKNSSLEQRNELNNEENTNATLGVPEKVYALEEISNIPGIGQQEVDSNVSVNNDNVQIPIVEQGMLPGATIIDLTADDDEQMIKSKDSEKNAHESNAFYKNFEVIDLKGNKLTIPDHNLLPSSTIGKINDNSSHQYSNMLSSGIGEKRKLAETGEDVHTNVCPPKKANITKTLKQVHKCPEGSVTTRKLNYMKEHQESAETEYEADKKQGGNEFNLNASTKANMDKKCDNSNNQGQAEYANTFIVIVDENGYQCTECPVKTSTFRMMKNHRRFMHGRMMRYRIIFINDQYMPVTGQEAADIAKNAKVASDFPEKVHQKIAHGNSDNTEEQAESSNQNTSLHKDYVANQIPVEKVNEASIELKDNLDGNVNTGLGIPKKVDESKGANIQVQKEVDSNLFPQNIVLDENVLVNNDKVQIPNEEDVVHHPKDLSTINVHQNMATEVEANDKQGENEFNLNASTKANMDKKCDNSNNQEQSQYTNTFIVIVDENGYQCTECPVKTSTFGMMKNHRRLAHGRMMRYRMVILNDQNISVTEHKAADIAKNANVPWGFPENKQQKIPQINSNNTEKQPETPFPIIAGLNCFECIQCHEKTPTCRKMKQHVRLAHKSEVKYKIVVVEDQNTSLRTMGIPEKVYESKERSTIQGIGQQKVDSNQQAHNMDTFTVIGDLNGFQCTQCPEKMPSFRMIKKHIWHKHKSTVKFNIVILEAQNISLNEQKKVTEESIKLQDSLDTPPQYENKHKHDYIPAKNTASTDKTNIKINLPMVQCSEVRISSAALEEHQKISHGNSVEQTKKITTFPIIAGLNGFECTQCQEKTPSYGKMRSHVRCVHKFRQRIVVLKDRNTVLDKQKPNATNVPQEVVQYISLAKDSLDTVQPSGNIDNYSLAQDRVQILNTSEVTNVDENVQINVNILESTIDNENGGCPSKNVHNVLDQENNIEISNKSETKLDKNDLPLINKTPPFEDMNRHDLSHNGYTPSSIHVRNEEREELKRSDPQTKKIQEKVQTQMEMLGPPIESESISDLSETVKTIDQGIESKLKEEELELNAAQTTNTVNVQIENIAFQSENMDKQAIDQTSKGDIPACTEQGTEVECKGEELKFSAPQTKELQVNGQAKFEMLQPPIESENMSYLCTTMDTIDAEQSIKTKLNVAHEQGQELELNASPTTSTIENVESKNVALQSQNMEKTGLDQTSKDGIPACTAQETEVDCKGEELKFSAPQTKELQENGQAKFEMVQPPIESENMSYLCTTMDTIDAEQSIKTKLNVAHEQGKELELNASSTTSTVEKVEIENVALQSENMENKGLDQTSKDGIPASSQQEIEVDYKGEELELRVPQNEEIEENVETKFKMLQPPIENENMSHLCATMDTIDVDQIVKTKLNVSHEQGKELELNASLTTSTVEKVEIENVTRQSENLDKKSLDPNLKEGILVSTEQDTEIAQNVNLQDIELGQD